MQQSFKNLKYIYWQKESQFIKVSQEELKNKIDELERAGRRRIKPSCRSIDYFTFDTYSVEVKGNFFQLKFCTPENNFVYATNWFDQTKNDRDFKGTDAVQLFEAKFEQLTQTTLKRAYGHVPEDFKRNIPKQFVYTNLNRSIYLCVSSIDGVSQYPSGLCESLPDSHASVVLDGEFEPNEEYPFAFYSNGHLAIYNELDTRKWTSSIFAFYLFRHPGEEWPLLSEKPAYTTLMKAAKISMKETWEFFFERRKIDADCKLVMNATIGCFHTRKYRTRKLAHIAAVTIARGNEKLLKKAEKVGFEKVVHICVDGMIYEGKEILGGQEKKLGAFYQEFTNCMMRIDAVNRYVVIDDNNEVVKCCHQGFNYYIDTGNLIDEEGVKCFKDMDRWTKIDPLEILKNSFSKKDGEENA